MSRGWRLWIGSGSIVGPLIGLLAFVNGKWLHVDRAPRATTAIGAILAALIATSAWLLFGVVLYLFNRRREGRTAHDANASIVLSGYRGEASYAARRPDWESVPGNDMRTALAAASTWVAESGEDAVVEAIREESGRGRVVGLVTAGGHEEIGSAAKDG